MLVINLHTLQTVNVLNFVDDITSQRLDTQQSQNILRISRTVNNHFTFIDNLTVMHQNLFVLTNQEFMTIAIHIGNFKTLFAFGFLTEGNRTGHFCQRTGIFW